MYVQTQLVPPHCQPAHMNSMHDGLAPFPGWQNPNNLPVHSLSSCAFPPMRAVSRSHSLLSGPPMIPSRVSSNMSNGSFVFHTGLSVMPPTLEATEDMMPIVPAAGAGFDANEGLSTEVNLLPDDEDEDQEASDEELDGESSPNILSSALSGMSGAGFHSLLDSFQDGKLARQMSDLGLAMSDAAEQARSLFYHYQTCHSTTSSRKKASKHQRPIDTSSVKRDVMFPTRTTPHAVFDDYEFCGDLTGAIGAFGCVKIVRRWNSEQLRACKAVRVRSAQERDLVDTEVELLKSLVHPNIVELHAVYLEEEEEEEDKQDSISAAKVYLVCEFCRGGDLASRIAHHRDTLKEAMSESHVAYMMQQLLSATKFCHDRGIIHRDLKPQNILFQTTSRWSPIKIIDFGLADFVSKIQENAKEVPITDRDMLCAEENGGKWHAHVPDLCFGGTGWVRKHAKRHVMEVAGTTPYMAPEVFARWYDHRYDNFSLGVILYELLCGHHPFCVAGDNHKTVKAKILSTDPEFLPDVFGATSFGAINLCKGLLRKDAEVRLTAAQALEHPWLNDPEKPSPFGNKDELTLSKLHGLVSYPAYGKFKRAVYLMLTKELSEQQAEELHKLFMALDVSGDGVLSREELVEGLQHVGLDLPEAQLSHLVAALSPTGSDHILYKDFISALIQRSVELDHAQLLECFRKFDTAGTGRICFQDIQNVLCDSDGGTPSITEEEWAGIVSPCMGVDAGAFELTFDDFVALLDPRVIQRDSAAAAA